MSPTQLMSLVMTCIETAQWARKYTSILCSALNYQNNIINEVSVILTHIFVYQDG